MTETQTEDDDDEGFGNFYFASLPYKSTVNSNQFSGRKPTTTQSNNDDDDEWGDFIEYPLRSELSSGLSHTQSPPNQSQPSKSFDPFEFFPDHSTTKPSEPVPSRVESGKTQWVKPKGALPLSIFGGVEEEEEAGGGDPHVDIGKDAFGDKRLVGNVKSGSIVYLGGEVSDIISNLYNQSQQSKDENGLISTSTPQMNGSILNLSGLSSNPDLVGGKKDIDILTNLHDQGREIKAENGFNSNSSGSVSDLNASSLKLGGLSLEFNGYNSENWPQSSLDAPISHLSGLNLEIHGFTSNLNERNVTISTVTGLNSNFDSAGITEEIDADDDGWEFQAASSVPKVGDGSDKGPSTSELPGFKVQWAMGQEMQAVERKGQETSEVNTQSSGLGNGGSHGSLVDRFATSNEFSSKSCDIDIGSVFKLNAVTENGFISETFIRSEQDDAENGLNSYPIVERADFDESFGHFTAAFPETGSKQEVDGKGQEISWMTAQSSGFGNSSPISIDLFVPSNDFLSRSREMETGFDFKPSKVPPNGSIPDSYFRSEQNDTENGSNSLLLVGTADFEAAVSETGSKQEGNETRSENYKGVLPLSIFGDEELETDGSLNIQDMYQPTSRDVHSQGSTVSISDLISNLHSQAKQIPLIDSMQKPIENGLNSADSSFYPNLVNGGDDLGDGSWEFKNAFCPARAEIQTSSFTLEYAHQGSSSKLKLSNHTDFYCKLKDQLCFITTRHLDSLKKAQTTAALSGEDAKVAALDEEIQEACKELQQENIISEEAHPEDYPQRDICLNEFLEVFHEPKFQVIESEYHLSRRLSSAEKDLRSAIGLLQHASAVLKILTLGSMEEQSNYISIWSKIISVCAQELKHGAWIWKQSIEQNLQNRILIKPQGKRFILALGEIYRVVVVLGASARFYKPWILSSSENPIAIYPLLEECHTLWTSSGLEEALSNISDPFGSENKRIAEVLVDSIKYIQDTDEHAHGNHVFTQQQSKCRLSLLTQGVVPGMKMIVWNREHYFLTLANLWANLISCDPPNSPRLNIG